MSEKLLLPSVTIPFFSFSSLSINSPLFTYWPFCYDYSMTMTSLLLQITQDQGMGGGGSMLRNRKDLKIAFDVYPLVFVCIRNTLRRQLLSVCAEIG
ncbi:Uncharacterized protein APZ42_012827 [Daphnia magna]|uniref:Uncharacterized protein n=1 Tax=Daphnia magna TaxID=35525 RepID=A0A162RD34_9CRUS|nr:Uncharacterized protein APZ42_012827 [Daphnia magna]